MEIVFGLALGATSWSFLEYVIHRWLGHDRRFVRRTLFGKEHTTHHSRGDYFAATRVKLAAAAIVLGLVVGPAILVGGVAGGVAYTCGLVGFYLYYEWLHRSLHVREGVGPYGRWARRHHFYHHFGDPRMNHGVTSPIWDFVFRTRVYVERVVVPEKLAMRWLLDPATGDVRANLSPVWAVRRRPQAH